MVYSYLIIQSLKKKRVFLASFVCTANIEKNVTIVGCNNHIELWNADYWDEVSSEEITPDNIAKVMEELEF